MRPHAASHPGARSPIGLGTRVGGFRVESVAPGIHGRWIATEASTAGGDAVELWVSGRTATEDPGLSEQVELLSQLRELREQDASPVVAPAGAGRDVDLDRWFFARPTVSAVTLAHRLSEGPIPREEAIRLLGEVAGGLDTLAAFGVPYAHLTPERILLSTGAPVRALLRDYGVAPEPAGAATGASTLAVVDYLAPEIARGAALDVPGTVYALACVLFEVLTGAPPFPYERPLLVLEAHLTEAAPRISERGDVPSTLDRVLLDALHKDPARRQATSADLLRATQHALGMPRRPIAVVQPSSRPAVVPPSVSAPVALGVRPTGRPTRRRLSPAAVAVAATLMAASTAGFATGSSPDPPASRTISPASADSAGAARRAALRVAAFDELAAAMERLRADRSAFRSDLRAARGPAARAAAAVALADAYVSARSAVARGPGQAGEPAGLDAALRSTELAHRRLATAARTRDRRAFGRARADVLAHERTVNRELARRRGIA